MLRLGSHLFCWSWVHGALLLAVGLVAACTLAAGRLSAQEPDAAQPDLAEPPMFPIWMPLPGQPLPAPDRKTGVVKAPILAWVPEGVKRLRALLIIPNNTSSIDFGRWGSLRAVAEKREMGVVYLRAGDVADVQAVLDGLAEKTGIREFRHAPWIVWGLSSRGRFPITMEWLYPKRTIAGISFHAETPTWPVGPEAKLNGETILHVNVNGEMEWGGTWYIHVRPSLLNYRAKKAWLAHLVVSWGVGHVDYPEDGAGKGNPQARMTRDRIWDYLALYVDKALALRVPTDKYPTDGPVELKQVDEASGYLIDPFAVEDLFGKPRIPLPEGPDGYISGREPSGGFAAVPPAADFTPAEGVPVTPLTPGRSPSAWLVTETMPFAMKNDPMETLGALQKAMPKPGDKVQVDDHEATFNPIPPNQVPKGGGIGLKRGTFTVIGYTVLDVPAPVCVKLKAPFTAAGRLQVVLNGTPVAHTQVVELQKGQYPMLVVLRKMGVAGTDWASIAPMFTEVSEEEVARAKQDAAEQVKQKAEMAQRIAEAAKNRIPLIRKASDVPQDQRAKMFWVADLEQAKAWFDLHALRGQKFE